jgi:hypothetical protein
MMLVLCGIKSFFILKINVMKATKIVYWISTGAIALFVLPGIFFLTKPFAIEGTKHLGMPFWFHMELGIAKFIGGIVLILPFFSRRIKEWAYVGFAIDSLSATIGLCAVDGFILPSFAPLIFFAILVISYSTYQKMNSQSDS